MSNHGVVAEVMHLCEENAYLKMQLEMKGEKPIEDVKVLTSMERFAIDAGRERLFEKYFNDWHFRNYGPKVYYEDQGMTQDNIKSFDEYMEDLTPKAFDSDVICELFDTDVKFKDFKEFFRDKLYEKYEELVSDRLNKVARENENVRATEE